MAMGNLVVQTEDKIVIATDPMDVWNISTNIGILADWSPNVKSVHPITDTTMNLGKKFELDQAGQPVAIWTVTQFEPPIIFAWEKRMLGMSITGIHEIRSCEIGTINKLELKASGILTILLAPILRKAFVQAIKSENEGLKAYCESYHRIDGFANQDQLEGKL